MKIHSFNVTPNLPNNLKPLAELAQNMWFTWNWEAIMMLVSMDSDLWHKSHRNPKWLLSNISTKRLEELSRDQNFVNWVNKVYAQFKAYQEKKTWYATQKPAGEEDFMTAYFSMEFGIGEGLPMYSGGLGMLSGDHIKSSSDLGMPLVGMGLFYQKGYIQQALNRDGWQVERYPENDWANMPVEMINDSNGNPLTVEVPLGNESIKVGIWKVPVGRTSLFLLDTNLPENPPHHRGVTDQLYGGDRDTRIRQEIVLGIGGVKALKAMGIKPTVYHINEGHSAFLLLERIREVMQSRHLSFEQAREVVWCSSVFTTHTPVIAGNEHFEPELVRKYLEPYCAELNISWDTLLAIGKEKEDSATFCMTVLALRLAAYLNGVSQLHGEVSRDMWRSVWPDVPFEEIPIKSITNGVHTASWISHEHNGLYKKYLNNGNTETDWDPCALQWDKINDIPDQELWDTHQARKVKMVTLARDRMKKQHIRLGSDVTVIEELDTLLDPNVLTIGFARRFATYKRANLIFKDLDRLASILNNASRPVQLVFAGKAHQADTAGKELVKYIAGLMSDKRFKHRLVFLEDYNMNVARYLVQGVDVWLNNPTRPMEASGTSGMKASINGVLNMSVVDGWWVEAMDPEVGWSIGGTEYNDAAERDYVESEAIYNLLEKELAPLYYERDGHGLPRGWLSMMKRSVAKITPVFNTHRMVREYYQRMYQPAHKFGKLLLTNGNAASVANWRKHILNNWPRTRVSLDSQRVEKLVLSGRNVVVHAKVWLADLKPEEVSAQLYIGKPDPKGAISGGDVIEMSHEKREGETHIYRAEIPATGNGRQDFAIRIIPHHKDIPHPFTPAFMKWEE